MNLSAKRLSSLALVLSGGALSALLLQAFFSFSQSTKAQIALETPLAVRQQASVSARNSFQQVKVVARAALVMDIKNKKIIFAKNADEKLPLASLAKLMTALLAREQSEEHILFKLTQSDLYAEGDHGLRSGEVWRLGDLLDMMLVTSSNDVAEAVASFTGSRRQGADVERVFSGSEKFVQMMNKKAKDLDLVNMEFFNATGLDVNSVQSGGYGTAREVAVLLATLQKNFPATLEATARKNVRVILPSGRAYAFSNTNEALAHIPGLIASKTGYTDLAGGNLAIIFDGGLGHFFVAVVLGSTHKGRFEDMKNIMQAVRVTL